MTQYGFALDQRACIGCHACTVACRAEHGTELGVFRTWVKCIETGTFPDAARAARQRRYDDADGLAARVDRSLAEVWGEWR